MVVGMKKKKLPRTPEEVALRRQNYIDAIGREADRGCVLVAASVLDEGLEQLLRAEMPDDAKLLGDLFRNSGPLATFWARSRVAFALGYISKDTFEDLEIIREVRNRFAHGYGPATLAEPETSTLIAKLKSVDRGFDVARRPENAQKLLDAASAAKPDPTVVKPTIERVRWAMATSWIMSGLETAASVYEKRRTAGEHVRPYVV